MMPDDVSVLLRRRRMQAGLSLRHVAKRSGIAAAALSAMERGESSPTLASLHKVLGALGTDLQEFFSSQVQTDRDAVFPVEGMQVVRDKHRTYTFLLPKRKDIRLEMISESILPGEEAEWESLDTDTACVVLSNGPARLEIERQPSWILKRGMAFYIKAGTKHRTTNTGAKPLKLLTVLYPPRY
jgi:transcriptional regulator with XRE-family HTH domain